MKQTILLIAVVALFGCGEKDEALQTPPESRATPKLEAKKPEANKVGSKPLFDPNNEAHVMIDHVTVEAAIRW